MKTSYDSMMLQAATFILSEMKGQQEKPIALIINTSAKLFGEDAARDAFWHLKSKGAIRFVKHNCITTSN